MPSDICQSIGQQTQQPQNPKEQALNLMKLTHRALFNI